jgi:beta-lactamase superfamily II metal-dependent hydrolase
MHAPGVSPNARTRIVVPWVLCLLIGVAGLVAQTQARTLDIYFIDTGGGQSTLYVGPTGESLLVDSGNAGASDENGRVGE